MPRYLLLAKATIAGYTRTTASGKAVAVAPHSDKRASARPRPIGPMNPHVEEHKVGKHPAGHGEPPAGASHLLTYDFGKGPVGVWAKKTRYGEMTHDGEKWTGTEDIYQARKAHVAKHGSW